MNPLSHEHQPLRQIPRTVSPPPSSKPRTIPKPPPSKFCYKRGIQNTVSPERVSLIAGRYITNTHKEVNPIPELEALSIKKESSIVRALKKAINSVERNFHGLTPADIQEIVEEIAFVLEDQNRKGIHTHKKDICLPRTIRYNHNKNSAYIFLKSKGKLPVSAGSFRRGTRAIHLTWVESNKKIKSVIVSTAFQLVTHDDKQYSKLAHKEPLELRIQKNFSSEEANRIRELLVPCHEFFSYEKIKKGTSEKIEKSCMILPYYVGTLSDVKREALDASQKIYIADDLLEQLSVFHKAGIIHGDVKGANVLLDNKARLADYDHSTLLLRGEKPSFRRGFYGTYTHTSPAILKYRFSEGEPTFDELCNADLYALGVELYKLVFGDLPWNASLKYYHDTGANSEALLDAIIKAQNRIVLQIQESITEYSKPNSNDSEQMKQEKQHTLFLMHLISDLLNPKATLTAERALNRIAAYKKN